MSFHAGYQCRHSGACCTAGWPIPIEADRLARLRTARATGAIRTAPAAAAPGDWFIAPPDAPTDTPALLAVVGHQCVFYESDAHRCGIQRALDHDALPLACRQFPRVTVADPRGVSITLSHYCPTAASLLDADEPVSIVVNAPAFPPSGEYVGLDACGRRGAQEETLPLPPLLRPNVQMDWESWWEWERLSVDLLANADAPAALALARLGWAVERARSWRPGEGPLIDRVREAFDGARHAGTRPFAPGDRDDAILKRFLAAHAFANWTAHLGRGLRTWLRSVEAPFTLRQSGLDVRAVDLQLRHLADSAQLAARWSKTELTPRP